MKPKPLATVTVTSRTAELNEALKRLQRTVVAVGIAKGSKGDLRDDGGPPNSDLGFIHEFGSPAANIPPRPFLRPGVEDARESVVQNLESAMRAALANNKQAVNTHLEGAGKSAVASVKKKMQEGPFEPLKPSSIESRHRSRGTKGKRENEKKGVGIQPLINTGSLQGAIDFLVEDG